ncbi:MAG: hypothetical protein HC857_11650 [Synechococcales cyanobacterium RU_4_20]|nr:hypothetical protein [Synechococcales cyanobacterium RU_4_20]NJR67554.1 hypothetical protein [Synechococcales cyanobacterium CRU_2_2]
MWIEEDLAEQPEASVPEASGNWAKTKATYRLWSNKKVSEEAILEGHRTSTMIATQTSPGATPPPAKTSSG